MKRFIAVFLCLSAILMFSACTGQDAQTTSTNNTVASIISSEPYDTTALPTEQSGEGVYEGALSTVSLPVITETKSTDAGIVLSTYTYQDVHIVLPDADIAEIITLDLINRIDKTQVYADAIHNAAEAAYSENADWTPYQYSIEFSVSRLDHNVLSLCCTETTYDGSPRSASSSYTINYDLTTGSVLSVRSIFNEEYSADVLCDQIIAGLSTYSENELFSDYQDIIRDRFSTNVPVESWFFTPTSLCFFFAPYEIGPYASGTVVAEIPYEKLSGLLNDAYFPTEELTYKGTIICQPITESNSSKLDQYTQFGELALSDSSDRLLITIEGSVLNLRIYKQNNDPSNNSKIMVFAVAGMGPTDAVIIQVSEEERSQLVIEYESAGETVSITP